MKARLAAPGMQSRSSPIQGLYIAAVTPRRNDEAAIDLAAALELVDFLGRSGANGIALLGSTGEFLHFDTEDRLHLIQFATKRSRVPVLVNVSHSCLEGALTLAQGAASHGAAGLLLMPPFFFRYGQEEIQEFYLHFARVMEDASPILLYNVPEFTTEIACETAADLLSTGLFAGIKDSSGRPDYLPRLLPLRDRVPVSLLVGNDRVFTETRMAGADGVVSGVACAAPELMLGLDRAIRDGAAGKRELLEAKLKEFLGWMDRFPVPVGVKEAVTLRGFHTGPHAVPPGKGWQQQLEEFKAWFPGWLKEVQKETANA